MQPISTDHQLTEKPTIEPEFGMQNLQAIDA